MHAPLPEKTRELVKQMLLQSVHPAEIQRQTGVKQTTQRTWINRYGWNKLKVELSIALGSTGKKSLAAQVATQVAEESEQIKKRLGSELGRATKALEAEKDKPGLKHAKARVEVLKPLAETFTKLYGEAGTGDHFSLTLFASTEPEPMTDQEPSGVIRGDSGQVVKRIFNDNEKKSEVIDLPK